MKGHGRVDPSSPPDPAPLTELTARPDIVALVEDTLHRWRGRERITPEEVTDVLLDVRSAAARQGAW